MRGGRGSWARWARVPKGGQPHRGGAPEIYMGSLAFSAKHLPERAASKTAGGRAKNSHRVRLGVHAPTSLNEEPSLNAPNIQQKAQKGHTFGPGLTETQSKAFSRLRTIPLFLCRASSKYFSLAGHAVSVSTTQLPLQHENNTVNDAAVFPRALFTKPSHRPEKAYGPQLASP